jgi:uridine kinase
MAFKLREINERCRKDPRGFIEECDRIYAARISEAAERILENMKRSPIVLLSGPSGSGKTTTAMKIAEELARHGVNTHSISWTTISAP